MGTHTSTSKSFLYLGLSNCCHINRQIVRKLAFIIFVVTCSVNVFAQTYRYKFQIEGVTDMAAAKDITDPLRTLFNTAEDPFRFYPTFNDERNEFDFRADIDVSQTILLSLLTDHALVLTSFVRYSLEKPHRFE